MPLVSAREYARQRGISERAVRKRMDRHGGPIPTHGPKRQIDVAEADALWAATMAPNGAATSRFRAPAGNGAAPEDPASGDRSAAAVLESTTTLARARTALAVTEVRWKQLRLERARAALISRDVATRKAFAYTRLIRDTWLAWPARIGPQLAATFNLDAATVTVTLEQYVRQQLDELSSDRCEF